MLLIEPTGIEIFWLGVINEPHGLLIEPTGIEISFFTEGNKERPTLLIEPTGIEINYVITRKIIFLTSN